MFFLSKLIYEIRDIKFSSDDINQMFNSFFLIYLKVFTPFSH
jgi:hypothetical protein